MLRAIFPCFATSVFLFLFFFFNFFFFNEKKKPWEKTIDGCLPALTLYVKTVFEQVYATFLTYYAKRSH